MYPHHIRLRGPWECEPLHRLGPPSEAPLPTPRRLTLPCRWGEAGLGPFAGRVRFRRRFGYPGRLDTFERAWLTFAGVEAVAEVWLNDHYLGRQEGVNGSFEFEVMSLLQARNELRVEVEAASGAGDCLPASAAVIRARYRPAPDHGFGGLLCAVTGARHRTSPGLWRAPRIAAANAGGRLRT